LMQFIMDESAGPLSPVDFVRAVGNGYVLP